MKYDYIAHGDCLELMKQLPDKCIDLIITDPPYEIVAGGAGGAFGADKRNYHKQYAVLDNEQHSKSGIICSGFDFAILDELCRIMKSINIYIWCSKLQVRKVLAYFEDRGCFTDILTWHKTNPTPTCNNTYLSDTEYLIFARQKGVKLFGSYATKKKFYVTPTNKADKAKYGHPTIKPLEIMQNLVINSSSEGEIVFDPFLGSGTTAVAAINTGRHYIGFELDKQYFDAACKRVEEAKTKAGVENAC
jgi:DNA modification methylase